MYSVHTFSPKHLRTVKAAVVKRTRNENNFSVKPVSKTILISRTLRGIFQNMLYTVHIIVICRKACSFVKEIDYWGIIATRNKTKFLIFTPILPNEVEMINLVYICWAMIHVEKSKPNEVCSQRSYHSLNQPFSSNGSKYRRSNISKTSGKVCQHNIKNLQSILDSQFRTQFRTRRCCLAKEFVSTRAAKLVTPRLAHPASIIQENMGRVLWCQHVSEFLIQFRKNMESESWNFVSEYD